MTMPLIYIFLIYINNKIIKIKCKDCHKKEHSGKIKIKGYINTSEGIVLDYIIN